MSGFLKHSGHSIRKHMELGGGCALAFSYHCHERSRSSRQEMSGAETVLDIQTCSKFLMVRSVLFGDVHHHLWPLVLFTVHRLPGKLRVTN